MRLAVRPLIDCCSINDFVYSTRVEGVKGDALNYYFMIVDLEKNLEQHGYNPPGLRFIPGDGSTLAVTVWNIDMTKRFTRQASNPFAQDLSIWMISLLPSDPLDCTISMKFVLSDSITSPATQRTCYLPAALVLRGT
jgi:hypothetical protein